VLRRGRLGRRPGDRLRVGRRAELDRETTSWEVLWRACSSAIRESIASRMRCRSNAVTTLAQEDNTPDNPSKHTGRRETLYLKHDRGGPASQDHDKGNKRDTEMKKIRNEE
jgi:hypothetical protein